MSDQIEKVVWQQDIWVIEYHTSCPRYHEYWDGKALVVKREGYPQQCFHPKRFWGRNRTPFQCLVLALDYVARKREREAAEHAEAALLAEEANALAEAAYSLAEVS